MVHNINNNKNHAKESNIIHNDNKIAKDFLDLNLKKISKFRPDTNNATQIDMELINKEIWTELLKNKKNTALGMDKTTYEMLRSINEETLKIIIKDANNM